MLEQARIVFGAAPHLLYDDKRDLLIVEGNREYQNGLWVCSCSVSTTNHADQQWNVKQLPPVSSKTGRQICCWAALGFDRIALFERVGKSYLNNVEILEYMYACLPFTIDSYMYRSFFVIIFFLK